MILSNGDIRKVDMYLKKNIRKFWMVLDETVGFPRKGEVGIMTDAQEAAVNKKMPLTGVVPQHPGSDLTSNVLHTTGVDDSSLHSIFT